MHELKRDVGLRQIILDSIGTSTDLYTLAKTADPYYFGTDDIESRVELLVQVQEELVLLGYVYGPDRILKEGLRDRTSDYDDDGQYSGIDDEEPDAKDIHYDDDIPF
jgi:hypothetical protein